MDYKKTAELILKEMGGKENLVSVAHCATRLRIVIGSNEKANKTALENIDGVKGVFFASGQLQLIIGTGTVNKVYDEFMKLTGAEQVSKEEVKKQAEEHDNSNKFKKLIKTLGDVFIPIIPAIVAGGFLMGIIESINFAVNNNFINFDTHGSIYVILTLLSNAAYTFLPILIGFSAAKTFGGNPFLGAVMGMFMIHPDLQNAWSVATDGYNEMLKVWFGLYEVPMVGYQGHVIPVIIAVFLMSKLEIKLHKIVPEILDLFVTPLVTLSVTGYLTFTIIGPVFVFLENGLLSAVQFIITLPFGIGGFIMGGLYSITVIGGIHHMYTIIDMGQLSKYGFTYWLPIASAANMAQAGATLAVAVKAKSEKIKSLAFPAALSAMLGITEPAIFGVNLRFMKPFVAAAIGGACGGLYASISGLGATGTGVTGLFAILLHLQSPIKYIILMLISAGVAFVLSFIFGIKEEA